jgi:hypothetical protein
MDFVVLRCGMGWRNTCLGEWNWGRKIAGVIFDSSPMLSIISHANRVYRRNGRRAEWQVSWGFRSWPVNWPGAKIAENRSPEADPLQTSCLGRFSTVPKNLGKRPTSAWSALGLVRTPPALDAYFSSSNSITGRFLYGRHCHYERHIPTNSWPDWPCHHWRSAPL